MANYRPGGGGDRHYEMAAWREPESPQLSLMSGCSSLFSISGLRDDDADLHLLAGARSLPATPVSFGGFAGGDEVDMELRQGGGSGSGGDDQRTVRQMRNRESALRSRARKRTRCFEQGGGCMAGGAEDAHSSNCTTHLARVSMNHGTRTFLGMPTKESIDAYVEELEKEVRRLVDDNLKLKKQCKELKREVAALVLPTKSSLRRASSTQF